MFYCAILLPKREFLPCEFLLPMGELFYLRCVLLPPDEVDVLLDRPE